ncbi:hypothetical protein E3N88_10743 [Mikania micrantha]|uniref:MI domain-containing protein n=1 Tax=Mikania micrantha TaxID=192012 RepID=A0A5N6PD91_9ASTR|nr:hypothetical protein E3N88_10743 [Mikania micrantha]
MDLGEGYKSNEHKIQPHAASESADLHSKDCTTKGGCGEKGKPGGLVDMDDNHFIDAKDPNYSSSEETDKTIVKVINPRFEEYKKKASVIVEEYFATDDGISTANELKDLDMPSYSYYFVKKLISMAMDRHDKEKEMAAVLLSSLYTDVIDPRQVYMGFRKLVESADDLIVDIPDTVDVLALFIARAVVDDILPPAFLKKESDALPEGAKGIDVIKRAEKGYLSAPLHAEVIERRWGGSRNKTVEDVKAKIDNLLVEYAVSGDKKEAIRCINDLKVPFFHHEIVKRAIVMAMERKKAEGKLLDLLKTASEECLINSSQISKGFTRIIDMIDDLSLDIPNAKELLQSLIAKAASEGWLCASSLKQVSFSEKKLVEESIVRAFKAKAHAIIQEYFLTGDVLEVNSCLESENLSSIPELKAVFVKRLIMLAMDRKKREKEMASVLLSSLYFPADDVVTGFSMLIESADDIALDIPVAVEDLAMFLARAVVDDVVKKSLVTVIEKKNDRVWKLLEECFNSGIITPIQMTKGFGRVAESLDDLCLDVPDARKQFGSLVERAKRVGWLDSSFSFNKTACLMENGYHSYSVVLDGNGNGNLGEN